MAQRTYPKVGGDGDFLRNYGGSGELIKPVQNVADGTEMLKQHLGLLEEIHEGDFPASIPQLRLLIPMLERDPAERAEQQEREAKLLDLLERCKQEILALQGQLAARPELDLPTMIEATKHGWRETWRHSNPEQNPADVQTLATAILGHLTGEEGKKDG